MFELVARRPALPRARQVGALLLSLGINSLLVGLVFATGGQLVSEVAGQARADTLRLVEVELVAAAPQLPAAAAGGAGGAEEAAGDGLAQAEAPSEERDEPGVEPRVQGEEGAGRAPGPAAGEGEGAGAGTGVGEGTGAGEGTGDGTGDGAGGALRTFSRVVPRRVVKPLFPPEARALGLAEVRCVADVEIDTRGRPTAVTVRDCPAVYRDAVRRAMLAWRFEPATVDGRPVAARFVQPFRFELEP